MASKYIAAVILFASMLNTGNSALVAHAQELKPDSLSEVYWHSFTSDSEEYRSIVTISNEYDSAEIDDAIEQLERRRADSSSPLERALITVFLIDLFSTTHKELTDQRHSHLEKGLQDNLLQFRSELDHFQADFPGGLHIPQRVIENTVLKALVNVSDLDLKPEDAIPPSDTLAWEYALFLLDLRVFACSLRGGGTWNLYQKTIGWSKEYARKLFKRRSHLRETYRNEWLAAESALRLIERREWLNIVTQGG